ncbi:MAG: response regulator transcription factor [Gaiellales bacterium]
MVRVVVGEDSYLVQQGIAQVLATMPDIRLVAMCETTTQLERAVATEEVDVVITDIRMPPSQSDEGIEFAARLRESNPEIGVIILSQFLEPEYPVRLFEHGSAGRAYLLKERIATPAELARAVTTVAAGGSVTDPKVVEVLVAERRRAEQSPLNDLTARELEVLALVAEGRSNSSIAAELFLTKRAVEKHINAIFSKLDLPDESVASRRVHAALLFLSEQHEGSRPHR